MSGIIERAVRIRRREVIAAGAIRVHFWVVYPARRVGKGSRTQIGPVHLTREQAVSWARENGYLTLGPQGLA